MAPVDLVGAVIEVIVAERLEPSKHASISAFLETKAASAFSFDLAIWFCNLGLIFTLRIGNFDDPMNALREKNSKQNRRSELATYDLTSRLLYEWA
jgi:hypothetical protein